eukprot:766055-Hanusia_phi.AAC.18
MKEGWAIVAWRILTDTFTDTSLRMVSSNYVDSATLWARRGEDGSEHVRERRRESESASKRENQRK